MYCIHVFTLIWRKTHLSLAIEGYITEQRTELYIQWVFFLQKLILNQLKLFFDLLLLFLKYKKYEKIQYKYIHTVSFINVSTDSNWMIFFISFVSYCNTYYIFSYVQRFHLRYCVATIVKLPQKLYIFIELCQFLIHIW